MATKGGVRCSSDRTASVRGNSVPVRRDDDMQGLYQWRTDGSTRI